MQESTASDICNSLWTTGIRTSFDRPSFREMEQLIESGEQEQHDLKQFLKNVRKYTDPEELTAEILNDLVDKIIVPAPDKSSGHRKTA